MGINLSDYEYPNPQTEHSFADYVQKQLMAEGSFTERQERFLRGEKLSKLSRACLSLARPHGSYDHTNKANPEFPKPGVLLFGEFHRYGEGVLGLPKSRKSSPTVLDILDSALRRQKKPISGEQRNTQSPQKLAKSVGNSSHEKGNKRGPRGLGYYDAPLLEQAYENWRSAKDLYGENNISQAVEAAVKDVNYVAIGNEKRSKVGTILVGATKDGSLRRLRDKLSKKIKKQSE